MPPADIDVVLLPVTKYFGGEAPRPHGRGASPKKVVTGGGCRTARAGRAVATRLATEPLASFASGWRRDDFQVAGEIAYTRSFQTFERSSYVWAFKRSAVKRLSVETLNRLTFERRCAEPSNA